MTCFQLHLVVDERSLYALLDSEQDGVVRVQNLEPNIKANLEKRTTAVREGLRITIAIKHGDNLQSCPKFSLAFGCQTFGC